MPPTITLRPRDRLNFNEKLALLAMPARKRIWILKTLGRWERQNTRQRIRQQRDVNGRSLAKRKRGGKGKILKRMGKGLEPYVRNASRLELTWKNKKIGRIAATHHIGQKQKMTANMMKKRYGTPDYSAPCTRKQAKRLRELGHTVPTKSGKGRKKPTLRYLTETMSLGQAGEVISSLSNKPKKTEWDIPLAERQVLGSHDKEVNRQLINIIEQARKRK